MEDNQGEEKGSNRSAKIEKEGGTEERVKKEKVNEKQKVSKTKVRSRRGKGEKTGD